MSGTAINRSAIDHATPPTSTTIRPGDGGMRFWPLRRPAIKVLFVGGTALLAVWSAIGLLYMWVFEDGPLGDADRDVNIWLADRRTSTRNSMSTIGSALSDTYVKVALVAIIGAVMVATWKRWHDAVFLATVVIFEASVFVLTSFIVGRERPPVAQLEEAAPSGSFPSGHAAAAVAFYVGMLVVVSWHTRRRAVLAVFAVLALFAPLSVATARTYRGMHHPVDVVAGMALGVLSLIVVHRALRAGVHDIRDNAQSSGRRVPDRVTRLDLTRPDAAGLDGDRGARGARDSAVVTGSTKGSAT
jgi:undecaprenyl-diphosphatase